MNETKPTRAPGFYWVRHEDRWVIAEWDDLGWWLGTSDYHLDDPDLAEIDERPITRADTESASELEARLWAVIDRDRLGDVPSDIVGAVARLCQKSTRADADIVAELRAALEFYASPFGKKDEHGELISVPDFYNELNFGERAQEALARSQRLADTARLRDKVIEAAREVDAAQREASSIQARTKLRDALAVLNAQGDGNDH